MMKRTVALVVMGLLATVGSAFSAGYHIHEQGAKAMGMANAFVAQADDPSAIFFNAGGIGFLEGSQASLGVTTIFVTETEFSGTALPGTPLEATANDQGKKDIFFPPNLYFTHTLKDKPIAFGVGVNSQNPLAKRWDADSIFRPIVTEISIKPITINPTVAYRFDDYNLSFGAGFSYTYAFVEKLRNDPNDVGEADLEGEGDGWGYNFGLLWKPRKWLNVGIAYRSQVHLDIDGDLRRQAFPGDPLTALGGSFTADAETELTLPDTLSLAVAIKPIEKLTLEFNADRFGWSSYDRLDIFYSNFSNPLIAGVYPLGGANPGAELADKDWNDVWAFRFGAQYDLTNEIQLRAGYAYDNTPTPDSTIAPDLPDADRHNFTVGLGYNKDWGSIDLAYMYVLFKDRKVDNEIQIGEYKSDVHLLGANVTLKF